MSVLDENQYGREPSQIPRPAMALISMLHNWSLSTDGNGATTRTLLFDYRKAFDLIDHRILIRKLCNKCKLPVSIDFLSDRSFLNGAQFSLVYHRVPN